MDSDLERKLKTSAKFSLSRSYTNPQTLVALLLTTSLLVSIDSLSASDNQIQTASSHNHLSWTHNETRFDFVFITNGTIKNILKLESDSNNYITNSLSGCLGHSACLFEEGKLIETFGLLEPQKEKYGQKHTSVYTSDKPINNKSQQNTGCDQNEFTVSHYCSTHWNPPAYLHRNRCSHIIEWHSPLTCHTNSTNYERPCYIYDPQGNLIDLTRLIRSDGSSYKVNTSFVKGNSTQLKGFYINVCNEAYDMCGPNILACHMDAGIVELGYNNLTSIKYDSKEVLLTSQGHYKEQCEGNRVKTVIRFVCKKSGAKAADVVGPKLTRSDGCTNDIEWETIHACPLHETKVSLLPDCKLRYDPLGIDIDVRQMTRNMTTIEVPNIGSPKKKMILGICKALPRSLKCEGKQTSATIACLADSNAKELSANNSQIVGSVLKSVLRLADDRLYLEMATMNKTCSTLVNDGGKKFNVTRQIGVRLEFVCSNKEQSEPTYLGFNDCNYVFNWGSPSMCLELIPTIVTKVSSKETTGQNKMGNIVPEPAIIETLSPKPPTSDDIAKKTAMEQHKETLDEATKIIAVIHDEHPQEPPAVVLTNGTAPRPSTLNQKTKVIVNANKLEPPKMNMPHKFFMISLIVMSLVAFLVIILVLDKKTRLSIPLGSIRRQARQTFQPQSVPYSRVVNDLDL